MNTLLLNRDGFDMPKDGWYQVAPLGEFAHAQAGVVQVIDREACDALAVRFAADAKTPNFAGLLVDFDHFSLDGEKRSEAAGWITELECRPASPEGSAVANARPGLWARIRWSDVGEEAVKGGRYRFLSPVWTRSDCVDLGDGRVRPMRLLNAAVTNDPNLKGMRPLSNRAEDAARFVWELGVSPDGRHCPSCVAYAGQVHTMAEWNAAGVRPGAAGLYCQGDCHCRLAPSVKASGGAVQPGPMRAGQDEPELGAVNSRGAAGMKIEDLLLNMRLRQRHGGDRGTDEEYVEFLANTGWADEKRVAVVAVGQAKAAAWAARALR
ncbi:MAG: hypothetical protein NTV49_01040 [Kiritimatiellaeota bacterium]|nr:hypothetical protein [Kiritimatiellota bacterium]